MPDPTPYGPPPVVPADLAPLGLDGSKPFWRSTTLQGLGVLIASRVLRHYAPALHVSDGDLVDIVQYVLEMAGALMVFVGRIKARKDIAPLLLGTGAAALAALMLCGCSTAGLADYQSHVRSRSDAVTVSSDGHGGVGGGYTHTVTYGSAARRPWYVRLWRFFAPGPLSAQDIARWDADLATEAHAVLHQPSGMDADQP